MRQIAACLVLAGSAFAAAPEVQVWKEDLPKAFQEAKASGQGVLLDFTASWCGWCKKMEQETFPDPGVKALLERFVCVRIDADKHPELKQQYGVKGLPTFLLLDADGKVLRRVEGFRGPALFAQELKKALEGDQALSEPLPKPQQEGPENPLPLMAERMAEAKTHLESEETGKPTQKIQEDLLVQLEEMIKQAEQQEGG